MLDLIILKADMYMNIVHVCGLSNIPHYLVQLKLT